MRILGIDYGDARTGIAITDALKITAQGLETIYNNGSDKIILRKLDEILEEYEIDTIVIGRPINMNGTKGQRIEITEKFLDTQIKEAVEDKLKNEKLFKRLGTTIGLAIVIVLV